jgi:5,10-methylenetetrahydromethanopterin reductase
MDFGISIAAGGDSWKLVERAEALGFDYAWFLDTQLLNADPFVVMAAAAMKTSRIRLGTGMLIPSNRLAPVTANALASLNKLAPGRIALGIATGFTARRTMGVGPLPLGEVETQVNVIRGLLERKTVPYFYEGAERKIRFLNPDFNLINTEDPIPVFVSALGPKGRALVARLGSCWTIPFGNVQVAVGMMAQMKAAWAEAGRDPESLYAVASGGGCVLDEGEAFDSPRAKAQAGPSAVMLLHDQAEASVHGEIGSIVPRELAEAFQVIYERYEPADARYLALHRGHLMVVRPEEAHLVTADLIRRMTFTGTVSRLREGLRALRDAGFRQFTTHVRFGQEQMLEAWAEVVSGL